MPLRNCCYLLFKTDGCSLFKLSFQSLYSKLSIFDVLQVQHHKHISYIILMQTPQNLLYSAAVTTHIVYHQRILARYYTVSISQADSNRFCISTHTHITSYHSVMYINILTQFSHSFQYSAHACVSHPMLQHAPYLQHIVLPNTTYHMLHSLSHSLLLTQYT